MSRVRVLVGTRKGAFVLTSDGKRKDWEVSGPHFAGWEIYHLKGSPADSNRLYASQTSGWFGQLIQRSDDGGKTWEPAGNKFVYDGVPGTHQWYDGTPHPWEFKRVWHLEPSLTDLIPSTQELRTQRCSNRPTVARTGRNFQDCAAMALARAGNRVPAECACTRFFSIRSIRTESTLRFQRRAHFVLTTPGKPGSRSIRVCIRSTFPIRMPRSATAFIASPCIVRVQTFCTCKNTGT